MNPPRQAVAALYWRPNPRYNRNPARCQCLTGLLYRCSQGEIREKTRKTRKMALQARLRRLLLLPPKRPQHYNSPLSDHELAEREPPNICVQCNACVQRRPLAGGTVRLLSRRMGYGILDHPDGMFAVCGGEAKNRGGSRRDYRQMGRGHAPLGWSGRHNGGG